MKKRYLLKIQHYTLLFFVVALLASCQKNLAPVRSSIVKEEVNPVTITISENKIIVDDNALSIDTLQYSIRTRISAINTNNNYFDKKVRAKTNEFYTRNNFQTKWLGKQAPASLYYTFVDIIKNSSKYALRPADYSLHSIEERLATFYTDSLRSDKELYDLDTQLTDAFFLFTTHVVEGRVKNAGTSSKIWKKETRTTEDVSTLLSIKDAKTLVSKIENLHPLHAQYTKLQQALEQYRTLEKNAPVDFPVIYSSAPLKPNDVHESFPLIRRKLSFTDWELDSVMLDSLRYDEALVEAIKRFQARHGLEPDGIIGAGTLKFINQSFAEKVAAIEVNLERMRWSPITYGDNYILVNVPEYKLRVYTNQQQGLEMKVIVGSEATATPIFRDTLRYIVFSPTWSVPHSIIRDEIIPRLKKDSTYYSGKSYTFYKNGAEFDPSSVSWNDPALNSYNYSVVQQPGKDNSLGLAKFIMPNKMSIYLHDTPNHNLFNRDYKALSHGCVRLDDPDKLAEYLLMDQKGWNLNKIKKAMNSLQTQTVFLKKPYPVQIEYCTAWVDDNGVVNFREDIYGHDRRQLALLKSLDQKIASK